MIFKKQFCRWSIKFNQLPLKLIKDLEGQFVIKARQYCRRMSLNPDDVVITMVKGDNISFSFVVTAK